MKESFYETHLLSDEECDQLIALWGEDHGWGDAYGESEEYISKRTSIVEVPAPIQQKIVAAVDQANREFWGYEGEFSASGEIYRYEPGDFFDWHMDLGEGDIAKRKITTLVQLSDPADYEGGELELFCNQPHTASRERGILMIYPSYIMHRVTEVTTGLRFSMGGELVGDPFR